MKKLAIYLLFIPFTLSGMSITLTKIAQHASLLDEYPKNKTDNWENPNFNVLYSSLSPHVFNQLVGKKRPIVRQLEKLLQEVTGSHTKKGLDTEHVTRLIIPAHSKVFVWGDISGGFHALMRMLSFLKEKNVLSNALKITQQNYYLVFNGNSISRGPYNIETLITLLLLMKRNPDHVFYLKGEHERNHYWTNYNFRHELKFRAKSYYTPHIPLEEEISHFFDTLPSALFITTPASRQHFIRISPSGREALIINERAISTALVEKAPEPITPIPLTNGHKKSETDAPVIAVVKSNDWLKHHYAQEGLAPTDQDLDAIGWALISTPIEAHQQLIGFSYDAFALLLIADRLAQSTITLFNRRADSAESLSAARTYNVQTGNLSKRSQAKYKSTH